MNRIELDSLRQVWDTNMAAVSSFCGTNMATVAPCETKNWTASTAISSQICTLNYEKQ